MSKNTTVRARVNLALKNDVEIILHKMGLSHSEAINLYYHFIKLYRGIPFNMRIPNELTLKTFKETDKEENLHYYKNLDEAKNDSKKW